MPLKTSLEIKFFKYLEKSMYHTEKKENKYVTSTKARQIVCLSDVIPSESPLRSLLTSNIKLLPCEPLLPFFITYRVIVDASCLCTTEKMTLISLRPIKDWRND
jgi:hypothetical protein